MKTFLSAIKQFAQDDDGITAIEYGLIAALMATAITAGFVLLSPAISKLFSDLAKKIVLS